MREQASGKRPRDYDRLRHSGKVTEGEVLLCVNNVLSSPLKQEVVKDFLAVIFMAQPGNSDVSPNNDVPAVRVKFCDAVIRVRQLFQEMA